MPEVPLIATKDFKYRTRRLMAGDEFPARNELDARILTRVRNVAEVPAPKKAKAIAPKVEEVLEAEVVEEAPKPAAPKAGAKARAKKAKAKK